MNTEQLLQDVTRTGGPVALIDGDALAFRPAIKAEGGLTWFDGERTTDYRTATRAALAMTEAWRTAAGCCSALVAFSGSTCFRKTIHPGYKRGRPTKPAAYEPCRDAIRKAYPSVTLEGIEADDVLGILATTPGRPEVVIVSIDKDLLTIPGRCYNPINEKMHVTTPERGTHRWMTQALQGDTVDGYSGCPGVGRVKANRIMGNTDCSTPDRAWQAVGTEYVRRGHTTVDALTQTRLARILQYEDYDHNTQAIRLWGPKGQHRWMKLSEAT